MSGWLRHCNVVGIGDVSGDAVGVGGGGGRSAAWVPTYLGPISDVLGLLLGLDLGPWVFWVWA